MSTSEWILATVFVSVCAMWITSGIHHFDITLTAMLGSVALLITGILTWEDVKSERAGWDIFVWYGGLLMLAKSLNETKVPMEFANAITSTFGSLDGRCFSYRRYSSTSTHIMRSPASQRMYSRCIRHFLPSCSPNKRRSALSSMGSPVLQTCPRG